MSVEHTLSNLLRTRLLGIPKTQYSHEYVHNTFPTIAEETQNAWLIPCYHRINAPATTDDVLEAQTALGIEIPTQYKHFLHISNGAQLFVANKVPMKHKFATQEHVRYHLFSTQELINKNRELFSIFHDNYIDDTVLGHISQLNYLAVCDATDDNYQAIVLDPPHQGRIFMLFSELMCRPYSELDNVFYYTLADTFEDWLRLILRTNGWSGRGEHDGCL